ncbi:MAG: TIGR02300 family protein [Azospirillaceae bacterium]
MAKPEWGAKRICHHCGTRYYDMRRDPIVCPSCGTKFDPEAFLKSRRTRAVAAEEPRPKAAPKPEVAEPVEDEDAALEAAPEVESDDGATLATKDDAAEAEVEVDESGSDSDSGSETYTEDVDSDEEDEDDSVLEDASELGDDDVDDVVDLDDDDENR